MVVMWGAKWAFNDMSVQVFIDWLKKFNLKISIFFLRIMVLYLFENAEKSVEIQDNNTWTKKSI